MLLSLSGFSVRYGNIVAVQPLELSVAAGRVVSVIGPNGAGKTSLLAGIIGLSAHSGSLTLDKRDLSSVSTAARARAGLSYVPTGKGVFGDLTVRENIAVACGRSFNEVWPMLVDWFPLLAEKEEALARTLSGGQRQIVSIARAMATSPRVILMDEPSMGLSPIAIARLRTMIEVVKQQNVGVLLAEQNASLALAISDQCNLMVRGTIRLCGTPAELRGRPEIEALYLGRTV